jgi:hypothetical protein
MGMKKAGTTIEQPKEAVEALRTVMTEPESGATAAIERLSKPKTQDKETTPAYKQRDYDAEALGKTRCVQFEAALMSPAIAGMRFDTMEQYLALVKQAADAGVAYSFQK